MSALLGTEASGAERRVAQRTRTLKRAKILFNNRFSTFDCIVRNISATGALLTIDEAAHLPRTFEICIADDPARPAKLVYRRGQLAGIRFLDVMSEEEEQATHFPEPGAGQPTPQPKLAEAPHDKGHIHRIVPDILPRAIVRNFRWS